MAHAAPVALAPVLASLARAVGLSTAEPVETKVALPPFDTAAMDGFAVAGPGPWRVQGEVRAGGPERPGIEEVAAEDVPTQVGVFAAQCRQAGRGESTSLIGRLSVGLFDPAQPAAAADPIVDGEDLLGVEERGAFAPSTAFR